MDKSLGPFLALEWPHKGSSWGVGRWHLQLRLCYVSFMAKLPLILTHMPEMRGEGIGRERKRSEESRRKGRDGEEIQDGTLKR